MYSLYDRSDDFQNIPVIDLTSTILMLLIVSPYNFFLSLLNVLIRKSIKEESLTKIRLTKSLLHERYAWQEVLMGSPQNDLLTSQWNSLNFFVLIRQPLTLDVSRVVIKVTARYTYMCRWWCCLLTWFIKGLSDRMGLLGTRYKQGN